MSADRAAAHRNRRTLFRIHVLRLASPFATVIGLWQLQLPMIATTLGDRRNGW